MVYIAIAPGCWGTGTTREAARKALAREIGRPPKIYYIKECPDDDTRVTGDGGLEYTASKGPPLFCEYKRAGKPAMQLLPPQHELPPEAFPQ